MQKQVFFYHFSVKRGLQVSEAIPCLDIPQANRLFNRALNRNQYDYFDITINGKIYRSHTKRKVVCS